MNEKGVGNMNKLENWIYGSIIVVPQVLSEMYKHDWQTRAIYLLASIAIILFFNLEKFEIFQVTKEGIKFKKVLNEAKEAANDLKTMLATTLLIQIKQQLITGGDSKRSSELYKAFDKVIVDNSIENEEIKDVMKKLREQCLISFMLDLDNVFSRMYDPKDNKNSEMTEKMKQLFNNLYSNDYKAPNPRELKTAFDEMKNTQESFLDDYPDWKPSYLDMYSRANTYIEKYEEFYNSTEK